jgi:hypothetical protein
VQQNSGSQNWKAVASSSDGTQLVAAVNGGLIYTSSDVGVTWLPQNSGSRSWSAVASSSDGTKLVATVNNGQIYTCQFTRAPGTSSGVAGYLYGPANSALGLLYAGGGRWVTLYSAANIYAF